MQGWFYAWRVRHESYRAKTDRELSRLSAKFLPTVIGKLLPLINQVNDLCEHKVARFANSDLKAVRSGRPA